MSREDLRGPGRDAGGGRDAGTVGDGAWTAVKVLVLASLPVLLAVTSWLLLAPGGSPVGTGSVPETEIEELVASDSSGHGHDGIVQGEVVRGLPGHDDGLSYAFVERNSWVLVPSEPSLNPEESDFLVTAWVRLMRPPGPQDTYDVVRKGLGTDRGEFKLEVVSGGRVRCTAKDQQGHRTVTVAPDSQVADSTWHELGCARVGQHWAVVVDGAVTPRRAELQTVSSTVALAIGSKYGLEDRPIGRIDDVRLTIADGPRPGGTDVAVGIHRLEQLPPDGWWRLDEPANAPADADGP